MAIVFPAAVESKLASAVSDRDAVDAADVTHGATVQQLASATSAEAAAKDSLIHAQAVALQSAHDAIDGITAFLQAHPASSPVTPNPVPTP